MLFLIPIGGGIPGGVLLAQSRGIAWPIMALLYFISDVMLAFAFEPIMRGLVFIGRRIPVVIRVIEHFRRSIQKSAARYGTKPSPLKLVLISFGVDPMTGRAAALAAGHGFVTGWLIAITGDMFYFGVVMVSTLWMRSVLGDGTAAMIVILVVMMTGPALLRKLRRKKSAKTPSVSP